MEDEIFLAILIIMVYQLPSSIARQPNRSMHSLMSDTLASPEFRKMLQQCIHCGLCLQSCPTYSVLGTEADSPRGRIALITAASNGRIGLAGAFQDHIDLCLGCRACETACPSGVQYGALVEAARFALQQADTPGRFERLVRWLALKQMMPRVNRLRWSARFLRVYQISGLQRAVRAVNRLPGPLNVMEGMLPELNTRYRNYRATAPALGQKHGEVAFFYGCVQEAFFAGVNEATIRVLQRNGYEVHFPIEQTCCGAAALHLGEEEQGGELARQNVAAFWAYEKQNGPYLAIINNAGGCGAVLKEYAHILRDDPAYAEKARYFSAKVMDISEFLVEHLNRPPTGAVRRCVTYSDSCHLRHAQKVFRQPRDLLKRIPGLELVELSRPERCCGSAGVYNIVEWHTAQAVLDEKMADIARTGAETVVATNTGCYFQLLYGVQRSHSSVRVVHLVELLDESYRATE